MSLTQLIYSSLAIKGLSESELNSILETSAKNNKENQITGMLLYHNGRLIQVLEGESNQVEKLALRIKADPRHGFFNIIDKTQIHSRDFPNWSMGFHQVSSADILSNPSFVDFFNDSFDAFESKINYGMALITLKIFAKKLEL